MSALSIQPGVLEGQTLEGQTSGGDTPGSEFEVDCDVCIVGSGAGGAVCARTLAKAGLHVVVLEEGGYFTKERFRMLEEETYTRLYQEGTQRATKDLSVGIYQGRAVGGGTVVNWTTCFRTPEHVLEHWRARYDVKGFDAASLAPYFDSIEADLGITQVSPAVMNRNNRLLYDGCNKLGFHVDTVKRNVVACAHTGYCGMGCPIDAKRSMLVSFLPDAMDHGATVISRCRVNRFAHDGKRVTAAECSLVHADGRSDSGAQLRVRAKRFVLSAGAINSPAILLRSNAPDESGMLGRRTFLHPVMLSAGIYDEPVNGFYGAPQSAASHHFADRGDEVGYFLEAVPVHPGLAASALPGFGSHHRTVMKLLPFVAAHIAISIDGFHEDVPGGQVSLDDDGRPVLDYKVAPKVWAAFRHAQKELARVQFATGARRVATGHDPLRFMRSVDDIGLIDSLPFEANRLFSASAHQMGGCMMSDDAKRGVVRSDDLRHHSLENLHVVDGSVFPTSLGVNPQESIYGLASLIANRITALS
jgi:choline dehydrogenase-like flavoprotein